MLAVTIWGWASPSRLARPEYRLGAIVVYISIVVAGICAKVCCSGLAKGVGSAPWRLQSQVQKPKCSVFMTAGLPSFICRTAFMSDKAPEIYPKADLRRSTSEIFQMSGFTAWNRRPVMDSGTTRK